MKKLLITILLILAIMTTSCNIAKAADLVSYTEVKVARIHAGGTMVPEHAYGGAIGYWQSYTFEADSVIIGAELLVCYNIGDEVNNPEMVALGGWCAMNGALCLAKDWGTAFLECNVGHQYSVDSRVPDQLIGRSWGDTHKQVTIMFPAGHGIFVPAGSSIWIGTSGGCWTIEYQEIVYSNSLCGDGIIYYVEAN